MNRFRRLAAMLMCFTLIGIFSLNAQSSKKSTPEKKKETKDTYKQLQDSAKIVKGFFNIFQNKKDYYFEIPDSLNKRDMLIVNRILKVPAELTDAGINRGINYENILVHFEIDKKAGMVYIRSVRPKPQAPEKDFIANSIQDNFISPLMGGLKIEAFSPDSSRAVVKINDLYNGTLSIFNNLYKSIGISSSVNKDLSRIIRTKAFPNNIAIASELTTKIDEGSNTAYITVEAVSSLVLLPKTPKTGRFLSNRVGYFTVPYTFYADRQSSVEQKEIITRWNLEPKDEAAYFRGELVEPKKPIVFYIDNSTPAQWRKYMKQGIEDWQVAFERAGFKNAIIAKELNKDIDQDDLNYSSITYVASEKMNAMGPSVYDPRSGEIIQADIIWWHNVISMLRNWIIIQTGVTQPNAAVWNLSDELLGDAMRFVACHEVGHSLGLRHNMIASASFPVDSLRNNDFVKRNGTSSSIMDYSRYNYVTQPGDGVQVYSPHLGVYDLFAIEYGYRWTGKKNPSDETEFLNNFLNKYTDVRYRYSEAQDARNAVDPRAQTEDLGDDAVKASNYGIANLKRLMPNVINITATGKTNQDYKEAGELYYAVISHWNNIVYHPLANIGGIYIENTNRVLGKPSYTFVPKSKQKEALDFILKETIFDTDWLFDADIYKYTFPLRATPGGYVESSPTLLLKNAQSYIFWDLLDNKRLIRMSENEYQNGKDAFTPVEMVDMLYNRIFESTLRGKPLTVKDRFIQKGLVDALIQSVSESSVTKKSNALAIKEDNGRYASDVIRNLNFYGSLSDRISDAISVKRGLLLRILDLIDNRHNSGDTASRYHYQDMLLRIDSALNLNK